VSQLLDAALDGELDQSTRLQLEAHTASCAACTASRDERLSLIRTLRAADLRYAAPPALETRVRAALARQAAAPRAPRPSWLQALAIAACAALVSALATFWIVRPTEDPQREAVIASHVAALSHEAGLVAVQSSERHTVKPWFQGKVDFAPTVKDLQSQGYVLIGGRVDHVGARPAAAVVYRIRSHVIDLFVWRARAASEPLAEVRDRGFSIVTWTEGGLRYSAISDVDLRDLKRFAELVREP
jgi:anti-sigma factor RsiW